MTVLHKTPPPSIRAIALPTTGGIPARLGFNLQDHVAATFCISMIGNSQIKEVWNEAHDDVTLILSDKEAEEVEFVQVKGHELEQLWTIAKLCEPDGSSKTNDGTSIFERSLSRHCCSEPCRFRIVTSRPVKDELEPLTFPLGSSERNAAKEKLEIIDAELEKRFGAFRSFCETDCKFWTANTYWDVVHSIEAVESKNLIAFEKSLEALGHWLLSDQRQELYKKLVRKMWDAAMATQAIEKQITRDHLLGWLADAINSIAAVPTISGEKLAQKMNDAHLAQDIISAAQESRMHYRRATLGDSYSSPGSVNSVRAEVTARLAALRARIDAGEIADDGLVFHSKCLEELEQIYNSFPGAKELGLAFLHGCMYSITDRCGHRFRRVTA